MRETTYRQYRRLWLPFLHAEIDNPDRTDHYLMAIRAELIAQNSKEGTEIDLNSMRLKFTKRVEEPSRKRSPSPLSPSEKQTAEERATQTSRAIINGFVASFGKNATFATRTKEEAKQFAFRQLEE